jgi:hypothetical protein
MADEASDRKLLEDAVNHVLEAAPAGWQRLRVEFVASAESPFARCWATVGSDPVPVPVLPEAIALLTEHHRRAAAAGAGFRKLIVERDAGGALTVKAEPSHTDRDTADGQGAARGAGRKLRRMWSRR